MKATLELTLATALVLGLAACGGTGGTEDGAPPTSFGHGRQVRRLTVDGVERELVVHVPAAVDGSRTVPVVVMIHGTSGSGARFY